MKPVEFWGGDITAWEDGQKRCYNEYPPTLILTISDRWRIFDISSIVVTAKKKRPHETQNEEDVGLICDACSVWNCDGTNHFRHRLAECESWETRNLTTVV